MSSTNDIILYHYRYSPYARRVVWYLTLRGISYTECMQPNVMPREDLLTLGIKYRRIPLLAIGRDVFCDSRLILRKLEEKFKDGKLGASNAEQQGIQKLLERFSVDGGVFNKATQLMPSDMPIFKDQKFLKDRTEMTGREWTAEAIEQGRPEALVHIRDIFSLLETTFFADGRDWILNTGKPTLADIEAIFPLHWLDEMKGALPQQFRDDFPKVFSWISRFNKAVEEAAKQAPKAKRIKGAEAAAHITSSRVVNEDGYVDADDPTRLKKGTTVEVWPTDSGSSHRDTGNLVSLTPDEIVIAVPAGGTNQVYLHMPRWGFRIREAKSAKI